MCSSIFVFFQALSVGIFPYVLKLLQSSARELRPLLVFIWAKILAVDSVSDLHDQEDIQCLQCIGQFNMCRIMQSPGRRKWLRALPGSKAIVVDKALPLKPDL